MIYLDDPNDTEGERIQHNWQAFLADEQPDHIDYNTVAWAQNKQVMLGATKAVVIHLSSHSQEVRNAAFRYALAILEGANKKAQKGLYTELTAGGNSEVFFSNCVKTLEDAVQTMIDEEKYVHRLAVLTARSTGGLVESREDEGERVRFQSFWTEVGLLIRMLSNMIQQHFLPLQNFLRDQHTNKHRHNVITKAEAVLGLLVSEGLSQVDPLDRSQGVMRTILGLVSFLSKCMMGPCDGNQTLLANSHVVMILHAILNAKPLAAPPKAAKEEDTLMDTLADMFEEEEDDYVVGCQRLDSFDEDEASAFCATQELQIEAVYCLHAMLDGVTSQDVPEKMIPNIQVPFFMLCCSRSVVCACCIFHLRHDIYAIHA